MIVKTINCPKCGHYLTECDAEKDIIHKLKCKHCGKWIWWNPVTNYFEAKRVPERATSAGVRFY